jgi:hypothetical protein
MRGEKANPAGPCCNVLIMLCKNRVVTFAPPAGIVAFQYGLFYDTWIRGWRVRWNINSKIEHLPQNCFSLVMLLGDINRDWCFDSVFSFRFLLELGIENHITEKEGFDGLF